MYRIFVPKPLKQFVSIRRVGKETIEYDVIGGTTYTHTKADAGTLWRANDQDMIEAFKAKYPDADINL